jgi:sigma-B regulation protein RsbU (phosphoserine phosphatase)
MFVTLFLGILNVQTGELEYCLGGHDPPYIIRTSGDIERMELTDGVLLGVDKDFRYESKKVVIHKGEKIFLYTDGVTEAMNPEDKLFSEQRLEKTLARWKDEDTKSIIDSVRETIRDFSEGAPQYDDITMLALKFYG